MAQPAKIATLAGVVAQRSVQTGAALLHQPQARVQELPVHFQVVGALPVVCDMAQRRQHQALENHVFETRTQQFFVSRETDQAEIAETNCFLSHILAQHTALHRRAKNAALGPRRADRAADRLQPLRLLRSEKLAQIQTVREGAGDVSGAHIHGSQQGALTPGSWRHLDT